MKFPQARIAWPFYATGVSVTWRRFILEAWMKQHFGEIEELTKPATGQC